MPESEPGYGDKVNSILKLIENPCFTPWAGYIEMAGPALGEAIIQLVTPTFADVIRAYFRPKGSRFGRHGRRKKGKRGRNFMPPDSSEIIGKLIPGYEGTRSRFTTDGVKFMWAIDGVIQRLLWYWLLADVTIDFFYNWTSAIIESEFCQAQNKGGAHFTAPKRLAHHSIITPFGQGTIDYQKLPCTMTNQGGAGIISGSARVAASVICTPFFEGTPAFAYQLVLLDAGLNIVASGGIRLFEGDQGNKGSIVSTSVDALKSVQPAVVVFGDSGAMMMEAGSCLILSD